ncbi:MAG: hypothetical protein MI862_22165 [Desulfobacterales bacterium]|nr:hypothetical protein [Desulfobacterales bacterium]
MIRHWYEPTSFVEWLKRAFSLVNIAVMLVTAFLVFSEFRFDWLERTLGRYLASTNESRPETGAIWEQGKHTSNAHEHLNEIISRQQDTRQNVEQADSFSGLASRIQPGQWVSLEKQQFKDLYLNLEESAAASVIEPAQLVWLLNGKNLERIFCEGVAGGIKIYFIDSQNRVIQQIDLGKEEIVNIENAEKPIIGSLSDLEEFRGRIYSASNFFQAMFKLPKNMIPDLMQNSQVLLKQAGQLERVGIWNEAKDGYIVLGFEFKEGAQTNIVFIKGREWAVWQLSLNLKGEEN